MMNKNEARAILQAGGSLQYSRASMGSSACAHINGQRLRIDVARSLMKELDLQSDKPYGVTKSYSLPKVQPSQQAGEDQASAPNATSSKGLQP